MGAEVKPLGVSVASLLNDFKTQTKMEGTRTAKFDEGFYSAFHCFIQLLGFLSENRVPDEIANVTINCLDEEVDEFFNKKCDELGKERKYEGLFDADMLEIATEKFEFLIATVDPSNSEGATGTYTLVKKTKGGFEVILANSHKDHEKFHKEVEMLTEMFDASVVKSK